MLDRITQRMYVRLGSKYRYVCFVGEALASLFVAAMTIAIIASYYDPPLPDVALLFGVGLGFTAAAVAFGARRALPLLNLIEEWRANESPTDQETVEAWEAACNFTLRQYRSNYGYVNGIAVVPTCAIATAVLDLPWHGFFVMLLAVLIPALYATVFSYSTGELLMRPAIKDIAAQLPDEFEFERTGLPVRKRLIIGIPAYTAFTGMVVAAVLTGHTGSEGLALSVLVSLVIGVTLSQELTLLLSEAITRPIAQVRRALAQVRRADYGARVEVLSSDELGELASDFNRMARGLQEREQMREAFGTYMDKEVARLILSGQFPEEGVEVDVSIMFCDVRNFTSYAEGANATEVVATLNSMFETMVRIVDQHGGHVDKFMGDGLLAVFGAPETFPDHADRAVAAACDIARAVNGREDGLDVGVGVNTGRVVAGSIGGAGRLNFSVIGDAVNVAARVEGATRQTGDHVLITAATAAALTRPCPLTSRGTVPLKGKSEPVEVLTPDEAGVKPAQPHVVLDEARQSA